MLVDVFSVLREGGFKGLLTKAQYFFNQTICYQKWLTRYDNLTEERRTQVSAHVATMSYRPLFSVIMPVYNPELKHLEQAIVSVSSQLYPHWELCIADDASDDPRIVQLVQSYCKGDSRIKFTRRLQRGHISAASNSCLEMASGEFIALLDHDDVLAPHALYMAAGALNQRPDLSLIYSDEDKIGSNGARTWPHFKPDWNADLMRSQNAVNHLGIYRTAVVRQVGGFRIGVEGCQDWDLTLRVSEQISVSQIVHLPYVLYHWRITPQSTSRGATPKRYIAEAGKRVLVDHLMRTGEHASVLPLYGAYFRVQYRLESPPPVAVISQVGTTIALERLVRSLTMGTDYPDLTLYLLTDAEQRNQLASLAVKAVAAGLRLKLLNCYTEANLPERISFAVGNVTQPVICLLDPECVPSTSGWLTELVSHALRPAIGVVGAKLLQPNGTVFSAGTVLGLGRNRIAGAAYTGSPKCERGAAGRAAVIQNHSIVSARCMVVRREVLLESGGFDVDLPLLDFGDVDFCLRAGDLGFRMVWTPFAELVWNGSTSEMPGNFNTIRVMRSRWERRLLADPAHNPNLSLENPFPMLAQVPRVPFWSMYRPEPVKM
jgi:glycosyltransferase involved in cell wall biosynthesis